MPMRLLLAAALAAGALVAFATGALPEGAEGAAPRCGPRHGHDLQRRGRIRIYSVAMTTESGIVPLVYACLAPRGRPKLLGSAASAYSVYRGERIGKVDLRTTTVRLPWLAFARITSAGADNFGVDVVAVNLRTIAWRVCHAGNAPAPPPQRTIEEIVLGRTGSFGWAGELSPESGAGPGSPIPYVGACDLDGERILDSGRGVRIDSLELRGSTLTWRDGRRSRSATLR